MFAYRCITQEAPRALSATLPIPLGGPPICMVHESEAVLLERAQGGDRRAFGRLCRMHHGLVYACAFRILNRKAEAEDAMQETFLRAYRAIARFDGRAELSTWLYRICVNVCLNHIRRGRRHLASDLAQPGIPEPVADRLQGQNDPGVQAELSELQGRLAEALQSLSPSLRVTVVLVLLDGLSHAEAGEILGCPEGTVAWRVHEARRRLRSLLAEEPRESRARAAGSAS
ncbi:MAG: RNA polymerase sigma factor [Myxococcales bacterium]|nr:RNA polymerase sigma factor [Myxococcales bacterium]